MRVPARAWHGEAAAAGRRMTVDGPGMASALLAAVTWATTGLFVRWLPLISAFNIVAWRLLFAFLATLPLAFSCPREVKAAGGALLSWVLAVLMVAYYLLGVAAFQTTTVAEAVLLINTTPLFVLLFQLLVGTLPARREALGSLVAFSGAALVVVGNARDWSWSTPGSLRGAALALAAAAIRAVYSQVYRSAAIRGRAPEVTGVTLLTFALGGMLVFAGPREVDVGEPLLLLVALGVVATAVPTYAYAAASRRLAPSLTASTGLLTPVVAAVLAAALLREVPSPSLFVGGGLILCGLFMMIGVRQVRRPSESVPLHERPAEAPGERPKA